MGRIMYDCGVFTIDFRTGGPLISQVESFNGQSISIAIKSMHFAVFVDLVKTSLHKSYILVLFEIVY